VSGTAPPQKIAFLGIGLMGTPMAMRLLNAGHTLTVWNRTRARAGELAAFHARVAQDIPDAVSEADLVAMEKLNPGLRVGQAPDRLP